MRIFSGGPVLTMRRDAPRAQAIAIAGERIVAVGDLDSVRAVAGGAEEIDLGGACLLPGFIDFIKFVLVSEDNQRRWRFLSISRLFLSYIINPLLVTYPVLDGILELIWIEKNWKAYTPGNVGIASRSGGMTTEIANLLTTHGIGQSTCIGIGGDPVVGSNFLDLIPLFEEDPDTSAVVLFCEPGGIIEEHLGRLIAERGITIPLVAFVAGRFVDTMPGVRFGHAATIVEGNKGTAKGKIESMKQAGVHVAETLSDIVPILNEYL